MNIDYQAKVDARKFAAKALQQAFPHLIPVSEKNNSLVAAAKNIRIELSKAFPGIKFSVKTRRFSGGSSIDVKWTDGPTTKQVDEIIERYEAGSFDGMTDCYDYRKDHAWTDAFGSGKYVHSTRDYSPELVQKAIDYLWDRYRPAALKIAPADYFNGSSWSVQVLGSNACPGDANAQSQIHRYAYKYDCIAQELVD